MGHTSEFIDTLEKQLFIKSCWSRPTKNVRILIFKILIFLKNKEKHLKISIFYICVPKTLMIWTAVLEIYSVTDWKHHDHMMYGSRDVVLNRWTDQITDGQKKWHIEMDVPPKNGPLEKLIRHFQYFHYFNKVAFSTVVHVTSNSSTWKTFSHIFNYSWVRNKRVVVINRVDGTFAQYKKNGVVEFLLNINKWSGWNFFLKMFRTCRSL